MDFYEVLNKRRTIRDFTNKEVSDEVLKKILDAAFKAPTNDHLRQLEFVVVRGRIILPGSFLRSRRTPGRSSRQD